MTQPSFVPVDESDQVRAAYALPVPSAWATTRPSEIRTTRQPQGAFLGSPGPDQGFALKLARRFQDRLLLTEDEHLDDVMAGCTAVAMRRAAIFGRAPVIHDLSVAFALWGFLGHASDELVAARVALFRSAAHHYQVRRTIADLVPEATLRLSPSQVDTLAGEWQQVPTLAVPNEA